MHMLDPACLAQALSLEVVKAVSFALCPLLYPLLSIPFLLCAGMTARLHVKMSTSAAPKLSAIRDYISSSRVTLDTQLNRF